MSELSRLKTPVIFTILGVTGDLAVRKVLPSLWQLYRDNLLPEKCSVIGLAKTIFSQEEFKGYIKESLKKKFKGSSLKKIDSFLELLGYLAGDFENKELFQELADRIKSLENEWGICSNKIFFLALPPSSYKAIFTNLAKVYLNLPCGGELGWTRILIEKPFGHNLESSRKLQKLLSKYFKEKQIYRIDHYLAKEIVQGISNFRFSNNLFENSWNKEFIEKIEIRLFETIGVEKRGSFYDSSGALRDIGQNHLLEMLSLITMKIPSKIDPLVIRKSRAEILETLKKWDKKSIQKNTYRAQHQGYLEIEGVKPNSKAETFFSLKTELEEPLFRGVPIIIEGGKRCQNVKKEIVVTIKHPPSCLFCEPNLHTKNQVIFQIEPKNQILIKFWAKKPGFETKLEERFFSFFLYEKKDKAQYVEEYAKLFYEAMRGNQTIFVSKEEVENLWRFTDPVIEAWERNLVALKIYKPGTNPGVEFQGEIKENPRILKREIGIIGLGKMGANLARRLLEKGWQVYGYNRTAQATQSLEREGLKGVYSPKELIAKLSPPRLIWLMAPAGKAVDEIIFGKNGLVRQLQKGDIVIDGGNSFYKDSILRFKKLKKLGISFVDVGVSGGPKGARFGASLMIGGEKETLQELELLFNDLAQNNGYQFFEGAGAGHFVKMIHNGIEYGMMQAIAEGFTLLKNSKYKLDLNRVADVYNHGSVIESRLIGWLKNAFQLHGKDLKDVSGSVEQSGEGEWTVKTSKEMKIKAKVIEGALRFRIQSEKNPNYIGKILSALREQFGGHKVKKSKK